MPNARERCSLGALMAIFVVSSVVVWSCVPAYKKDWPTQPSLDLFSKTYRRSFESCKESHRLAVIIYGLPPRTSLITDVLTKLQSRITPYGFRLLNVENERAAVNGDYWGVIFITRDVEVHKTNWKYRHLASEISIDIHLIPKDDACSSNWDHVTGKGYRQPAGLFRDNWDYLDALDTIPNLKISCKHCDDSSLNAGLSLDTSEEFCSPFVNSYVLGLNNDDAFVRAGSADTLGSIGDRCSIVPLINALKDPVNTVRLSASSSLMKITGTNHGENAQRWLEWWENNKSTFPNAVHCDVTETLPIYSPRRFAHPDLEQRAKSLDAPLKAKGYLVANIIAIEEGPEDAIIGRQNDGKYFRATVQGWGLLSLNKIISLSNGVKDDLEDEVEHPLVWLINKESPKDKDYDKHYQALLNNARMALFGRLSGSAIVTLSDPRIPEHEMLDENGSLDPAKLALHNLSIKKQKVVSPSGQ